MKSKTSRLVLPVSFLFITAAVFLLRPVHIFGNTGRDFLRIHFIDVGYGDATLIEFPDLTNMLIDAGDRAHAPQLMNYLKSRNVGRINTAVMTHPHKNHFGGFFSILKDLPVERLLINGDTNAEEGYAELMEIFKEQRVPANILRRGQLVDHLPAAIQIEALSPEDLSGSPNDNSIVLRLKYKDVVVLFMGDVSPEEQKQIIGRSEGIQQVNCIKVPHHGGPLSDRFIKIFKDKIFVISTGPSLYGWPSDEDIQKLKGEVYRTDRHGTVVLKTDGSSIKMIP